MAKRHRKNIDSDIKQNLMVAVNDLMGDAQRYDIREIFIP